MNIKNQIPNLLTLGNLLCGTLMIIASFNLDFVLVIYLAAAALILDFLDGTVARLLKITSGMGKELDSMADMISFGAAPALVLFNYWKNEEVAYPIYFVALILAAFAGYRLAKFNISEQSNEYFQGLPTPALAIACFSLPLAAEQFNSSNIILNHPAFIFLFVVIGGFLLVSNVKLFSIKIGSNNSSLNIIRISMLITCLVLIVWLHFLGVFLCLIAYLGFSLTSQKHIN